MICYLKFGKIKSHKTKYFINRIYLSNLSDKLFSIITLKAILFFSMLRHIYLFLDIVKAILTSKWCFKKLLSWPMV